MYTTVTLDEDDIKKIVAKHFKVNQSDIDIEIYKETRGYGESEYEEDAVKIEVITERCSKV